MPTIYQTAIVALLAAFTILVLSKTDIRYKLRDICDTKKLKYISKMLDCDFCFGFWLAVLIAVISFAITLQCNWLITPFLSAPLIRLLV